MTFGLEDHLQESINSFYNYMEIVSVGGSRHGVLEEDGEFLRNEIRRLAAAQHDAYPQYDGHWDGDEWILAVIKKDVFTKMGQAFMKLDIVLAKYRRASSLEDIGETGHDSWIIYSVRNGINTDVDVDFVRRETCV